MTTNFSREGVPLFAGDTYASPSEDDRNSVRILTLYSILFLGIIMAECRLIGIAFISFIDKLLYTVV